jgi:hypothetical protein
MVPSTSHIQLEVTLMVLQMIFTKLQSKISVAQTVETLLMDSTVPDSVDSV